MKKFHLPLWIAFGACTLTAAVLQCVSVLTLMTDSTNYFQSGSSLPSLAVVFAVLAALIGTVAAFTCNPENLCDEPFFKRNFFSLTTVGFVLVAIVSFTNLGKTAQSNFHLFTLICSVIAVAYCIIAEIPALRQKRTLTAYLNFAPIFACASIVAILHFDSTVEMNAPIKVFTLISILCVMVLYGSEIRYHLDRPMSRMYLMLISWTLAAGSLSALSVPLIVLTSKSDRTDYACYALLVLCACITAVLRLVRLLKPNDLPDFITKEQIGEKDQ